MKKLICVPLLFVLYLVPIETARKLATTTGLIPLEVIKPPWMAFGMDKAECEMSKIDGKWVPQGKFTMNDCIAAAIRFTPVDHYDVWWEERDIWDRYEYKRHVLGRT